MPETTEQTSRRERFAVWSAAGLIPAMLGGLAFVVLLSLVAGQWAPLARLDQAVVDVVNGIVAGRPVVVQGVQVLTALGGSTFAWIALSTTAVWLLVRRQVDLALYVAVAGFGAAILTHGTKELVDRVRPIVDAPVATAAGHSFPSGHTLTATTMYGVLALVFVPLVRPRWRRPLIGAAIALPLVVGMTRVALGVHFPSDVVGGWLVGLLWLFVTAATFRRWEQPTRHRLTEGLAPEQREALRPAPAHDRLLPRGRHSASELLVAAVLTWGAVVGVGLLLTGSPLVQDLDRSVTSWFREQRSDALTPIAVALGWVGHTVVIIGVLVVAVPLALAFTGRWRPALFLLLATVGESAVFMASQAVVGRDRPALDDIDGGSPGAGGAPAPGDNPWELHTSSFPSGHVAATLATYGAIALLIVAWTRGRARFLAPVVAVGAACGVAFARMYIGVHHATDVLASLLFASAWLAACWVVLRPGERRGVHSAVHAHRRAEMAGTHRGSSQEDR